MSKAKAPMSNKKFLSIWIPVLALLTALVIAANIAANMFAPFLDHYLGSAPFEIVKAEGSEGWDSEYYTASYKNKKEATAAGEALVTRIGEEGIVLLKNNGVLPLSTNSTISLIGRYAADPVYGGAGSGTVDPSSCVNFYKGIAAAGFRINDTAYQWIEANYPNYPKANIVMDAPEKSCYYIGEIPYADYSAEAKDSLAGTTAVIVLGRGGGEGGDLSRDLLGDLNSGVSKEFTANKETANYEPGQHELELTREEKDLIAAAKQSCGKVIVLINASTSMELAPLISGEYEVDAILQVGSIGSTAAVAIGEILAGTVNPSGRTNDIYPADFTKDPTFQNFGDFQYTDVNGFYSQQDDKAYFVEYTEGIYVGYRYYETAYAEAQNGNYAGFNYDEAVVFPFGYGLSYTTFEKTLDQVEIQDGTVDAVVTVTNTGSVAGKDVVEIYYSAPYIQGGIEKSAVVLGGFEKTALLAPGESQTVTVSYPVRDMASYDTTAAAYVQDAGDYIISLRNNSHDVVAEHTLTLDKEVYDTDSATGNTITNKFEDTTAYMQANTTAFSRSDFAGTFPKKASDKTTAEAGITVSMFDAKAAADPAAEMPTLGAQNGLNLIDMRGLDYDDAQWELLLDELTVEDMVNVLNNGAYNTAEIPSIGKPATSEPDGPQGFTSLMGSTGNCSYCSEYLMAQTWNKELMYDLGVMIGEEALASGYNGWYAPAMNTHRSPFAGRNFEYYSEDGTLGGLLASATISGAASRGCYAFAKHFALNDQETHRTAHLMTWADEQTIREIYLHPFELAVKNAAAEMKYISDSEGTVSTRTVPGCTAVMSSFNFIGTEWAGGRKSLCTGILREEWGFTGFVITDFNLYDYMNKNQAFYAGTDHMLTYAAMGSIPDTTSASAVQAMRQAMHRILFTIANSNAMNNVAPGTIFVYGTAPWKIALNVVSGTIGILILAGAAFCFVRVKKNRQTA